MATIKDVSKLANVSISTVSRVVNNTAKVDPDKRVAVEKAMKELKYRPNSFAQALVNKKSNCIGLMVGDLGGGPFFVQMIRGIERELETASKYLMVMSGHHQHEKEQTAIDFLLHRQCDALILHSVALSDKELMTLSEGDIPIIIVNRLVPGLEDRCIYLNNFIGAKKATAHLIELGHKKIAYIATNELQLADGAERMAGYKAALEDAGIVFDSKLVEKHFPDENGGAQAMQNLLDHGAEFSALFCHNDSMVAGAVSLLRDCNYRVPRDVSVIGFDDIKYARFVHPKLTTVRYPIDEMGQKAAQLALKLLNEDIKPKEGDDEVAFTPKDLYFQPELIVRDSAIEFEKK